MSDDIVDRLRVVQCCVFEPRCERCQADDAAAAEIDRLRDGIAKHKQTLPFGGTAWDRRLWALIEDGDDG